MFEWTDEVWNPWIDEEDGSYRLLPPAYWQRPLMWNEEGPKSVLVGSSCDVFKPQDGDASHARARLWDTIDATPRLTWKILSDHPENMATMVPTRWIAGEMPSHVWFGTRASDQRQLRARVPLLASLKAVGNPKTFLILDPVTSLLDLRSVLDTLDQVIVRRGDKSAERWLKVVADHCRERDVLFHVSS